MSKLNIILIVIMIVLLLIGLFIIIYRYYLEKIDNINSKLNEAKNDYDERVKEKHNIVLGLIDIIETKYKIESKTLKSLKKVKEENIISIENEKLLNKCYKEIIDIKEDNKRKRETKQFKELLNDYEETDLYLISLRTYYNKYTLIFNNIIKKFPINLISKIKGFSIKELIEGKELDSNFNNDLEV